METIQTERTTISMLERRREALLQDLTLYNLGQAALSPIRIQQALALQSVATVLEQPNIGYTIAI